MEAARRVLGGAGGTAEVDAKNWRVRLTDDQQEAFEERAAIMEFDAGMTREQAEAAALQDILKLQRQKAQKESAA